MRKKLQTQRTVKNCFEPQAPPHPRIQGGPPSAPPPSQASLLIPGFRWLCQRSLHCFPILPGNCEAIKDHFFAPYFFTSDNTFVSSSAVHGPFPGVGFRTFCHLCKFLVDLLCNHAACRLTGTCICSVLTFLHML